MNCNFGANLILSKHLYDRGKLRRIRSTDRHFPLVNHTMSSIASLNPKLTTLSREGRLKEAIDILLNTHNSLLRSSTYLNLLDACIAKNALSEGKQVHSHINSTGAASIPHTLLPNRLIHMYDKCGSLVDARIVFNQITEPDVFSWNMIISAHRRHELPQEAFTLFRQMQQSAVHPDHFTFSTILPVCTNMASLKHGLQIHGKTIRCGFQFHDIVMNTLMVMYAKCGKIEKARELFDKMHNADLVSWNAMITGYVQNGVLDEALRLFKEMPQRDVISWNAIIVGCAQDGLADKAMEFFKKMRLLGIKPNPVTFASILPACAQMGALKQGMEVHQKIMEIGFLSDVAAENALIDMYAKCGSIHKARKLFDKMDNANVVSWNSMVTGYAQNGVLDEALRLFKEMPQRDMVSWTAIIGGCAQDGLAEKATEIFKQMQLTGVNPDPTTLASILPACAKMGALEQGMEIHQKIMERGFLSDVVVENALIGMYAKCGSIHKARKLFDKMPQRIVVSWNAMIAGYAMQGNSKDALELFELMKHSGTNPNHVSFVCVLFACSHAGLVDDGCKYFKFMSDSYGILGRLKHYACMVDLLCRAGHLEEALNFVIKMPVRPDWVAWTCLLGACRSQKNVRLGEFVARLLFELDPTNSAPYALLSNTYAGTGRWDEALKIRKLMKDRGIKQIPGRSWIEVHKILHAFCAEDESHPQRQEIYSKLEKLSWEMKAAGYIPDTRSVLNNVDKDEKEVLHCHHSDMLAIAFGLLNTSPGTIIRVVKNFRVCSDCHTATKFISKIVAREIVVRATNRFHHFKHGQCSCEDYS